MPISIQDQNNIPETECLVQDAGLAKEGDILHRFKSNIQTANSKNVLLLRSAVAALLLGFIIGLIWHTSLLQTRSYITITTCGNTSAEAIAVGCEFDILSYSWMPPQCLDRDTAEEFEDWLISNDRYQGPWPFFTDETGKERVIDKETLSHRTNTLTWTTEEEHLGHCTFLSRRLHRSLEGKFSLNSRSRNYTHTKHCSELLLKNIKVFDQTLLNTTISHFGLGFETC